MNKKRALLIGDYTHPKFYPLQGVDREITHILNDSFSVQCTENNHMLEESNLQSFDLCISYHDSWREKLSSKQTSGLLSCISGGRGLLVLHNGIVLQKKYEIAQLIGARNVSHPSLQTLQMRVTAPDHDIMLHISPFEIEDEPYRFEFDPFCETTILLEYEMDGEWHPAAWAHSYGLGRVVYLLPGRDQAVFQHPEYRKLVLQAAKWAARSPG
ncbi:ThuA domain-containing protein [Paenibacillus fonticola]|uniref:ThuA domain-containing protein n=1 Tax=Paenibacillus fonticola TaxID=379896 RepID=UPI00037DE1D1|nr:ThuA domain-containing protein [Paenibacillus fonticola]